jgi:predicted NBD/HSP70 family sugar kinase
MDSINKDIHIGLDIGGTKLLVASADSSGGIIKRVQHETPPDLAGGLELLDSMIGKVSDGSRIKSMGAAIGGPLDWQAGIVSPLHQPAWRDVPLKKIMTGKWRCDFHVDVDTNIAALGEYHFGGEKAQRLLYLTLSTGMGGGYIVGGRIYRGFNGVHPEAGHQSINFRCSHPQNIACECGAPDCLEALVSGNGIRRIYGKPAEELDPGEWEEVTYNLGQGLRNLAAIYLPDVIAIGGGVAVGAGEKFINEAASVMAEHLRIVPSPLVRLSRLGYDTALMGAIAAAIYGIDSQE